jgi:hypothetical protein
MCSLGWLRNLASATHKNVENLLLHFLSSVFFEAQFQSVISSKSTLIPFSSSCLGNCSVYPIPMATLQLLVLAKGGRFSHDFWHNHQSNPFYRMFLLCVLVLSLTLVHLVKDTFRLVISLVLAHVVHFIYYFVINRIEVQKVGGRKAGRHEGR